MNTQLNGAIVQGLMWHGLNESTARSVSRRALASQHDEWDRIIARCKKGEVSRVYLFVAYLSDSHFRTFVYAPGTVDNSTVIAKMLGDRTAGEQVGSAEAPRQAAVAAPVSMFDIAGAVCAVAHQ